MSKSKLAKEIGVRIEQFANDKFGSINKLAIATGIHRVQLYNYISRSDNQPLPGAEILVKLHKVGCDLNWLLTGKLNNEYSNVLSKYSISGLEDLDKRLKNLEELKIYLNKIK